MNADEAMSRINSESVAAMEPYLRRNIENLHRVGRIIGGATAPGDEDGLRSAVVFLHATVEDFLRSLASAYLPQAGESVLNRVPLMGNGSSRPEKFWLGRLAAHADKSVAELIRASVEEYLSHTTFNDPSEVAELLRSLGFDIRYVEEYFAALGAMMKRRHQIVHRADYDRNGKLAAITAEEVLMWTDTAVKCVSRILAQVGAKEAIASTERLLREFARERGFEL